MFVARSSNLYDGLNTLRHGLKQTDLRVFWPMKLMDQLCRMEPSQVFTLQTVFQTHVFFICMYFMYFLPHFWGWLIGHHWSCSTVEEAGKEQLQWRQHTLLLFSVLSISCHKLKKNPTMWRYPVSDRRDNDTSAIIMSSSRTRLRTEQPLAAAGRRWGQREDRGA